MTEQVTTATESEKAFLTRITAWSIPGSKFTRLQLLQHYQSTIPTRTEWGGINKLEVEQHVVALIEREVVLG